MHVVFHKYQGAGNDFVLVDNRNAHFPKVQTVIEKMCDRHFGIGADGLMLLEKDDEADFKMVYYNSDGRESTMCGNGGRCIVAFANALELIKETTEFIAIDGLHTASINGNTVKLGMISVDKNEIELSESFAVLNTGSPHYISFRNTIDEINIISEAQQIRYNNRFTKEGINVNFVEILEPNHLKIRTYERGVEDETLACGTGVTAAVLAYAFQQKIEKGSMTVQTKGDVLKVHFQTENSYFSSVILEGKATFVFEGTYDV